MTNDATPTTPAPREVDLRGIDMTQLLQHAEDAINTAKNGEAITVLADQEVVVKYITPTAAMNGVRCRFGPAKDGVWRIDLAPRATK
jgi:TusA-related sulfurtransferase